MCLEAADSLRGIREVSLLHRNKVVFHFGRVSRSQCPSCLATRGSGLADYADFLASSQLVCLDKPGDGRDRRQRALCVGVEVPTRALCILLL